MLKRAARVGLVCTGTKKNIYNSKGRICPIDYLHPFLRDMMLDYENEGLASRVRIGKGSGLVACRRHTSS